MGQQPSRWCRIGGTVHRRRDSIIPGPWGNLTKETSPNKEARRGPWLRHPLAPAHK